MMGIPESQHAFVFEQTNIILGLGDPEYVAPGSNPADRRRSIRAGAGSRR